MRTGVPERALQIEHADLSLLGNREENQDRVAIAVGDGAAFLAVVDGMGGHADGARAAETAIRVMVGEFWDASQPLFDPEGFLHLTIGRAHDAVVRLGQGLPPEIRPRATCAICLVQGSSAYWAHVGDSRVYQLRGGEVVRAHARPQPRRTAAARRAHHREAGAGAPDAQLRRVLHRRRPGAAGDVAERPARAQGRATCCCCARTACGRDSPTNSSGSSAASRASCCAIRSPSSASAR